MNILLNSNSEDKKRLLENALDGQIPYWGIGAGVIGEATSNLPLSIEAITQQSVDKSKLAKEQSDIDLGVGMEAGLEKVSGIYQLIAVVAFWDGEVLITGKSNGLPLPIAVSDKVTPESDLKSLIEEYRKVAPEEEMERLDEILNPQQAYNRAIETTLPQLKQRSGMRKDELLISLISPHHIKPELSTFFLKLSSIATAVYLTWGSVLVFVSYLMNRPDVRQFISLFIPVILLAWVLGLLVTLRHTKLKNNSALRSSIKYVSYTLLFFGVILMLPSWSTGTLGSTFLLILVVTVTVLAMHAHYRLLNSFTSIGIQRTSIRWSVLIGLFFLMVSGWGRYFAGSVIIFPLFTIGLLWTYGVWQIACEVNDRYFNKAERVSAKPIDRN